MSASRAIPTTPTAISRGDRVLRYTLAERINHWIAGFSYIYCLLTGLAFWSPNLFWMAVVLGGAPTSRFWHPWFGVIFAASTLWMFKLWRGDMATTEADLQWKKAMSHYIRNEDKDLPPVGRFNYGQKLFFWVMFYGAILLLLSGIGLWFVDLIPWSLRWLRYLAVTIHVAAALVTIGAFIIRGEVSAAWAKMHHRLWYEQVTKETSSQK